MYADLECSPLNCNGPRGACNARKGVGLLMDVCSWAGLKGRARPMGNRACYWSACDTKVMGAVFGGR